MSTVYYTMSLRNFILFVEIRLTWIVNVSSAKRLRKSLYRNVSGRELRGTIAASLLPFDLIEVSSALINGVPLVDHRVARLHRWRRRMLRFGAATFHQPSRRHIAVQANAKWAFIAGLYNGYVGRRTCDDGIKAGHVLHFGPAWQDVKEKLKEKQNRKKV